MEYPIKAEIWDAMSPEWSTAFTVHSERNLVDICNSDGDDYMSVHVDLDDFRSNASYLLEELGDNKINTLKAEIRQLKEENLLLQIRISALQHISPNVFNRGK